jgi:hypothetical protein
MKRSLTCGSSLLLLICATSWYETVPNMWYSLLLLIQDVAHINRSKEYHRLGAVSYQDVAYINRSKEYHRLGAVSYI